MPRARRMMRRRRVARVAVGSAVMAGTAGAVHHHQAKKWANQDAEEQGAQGEGYEEGEYTPEPEQYAAPAEAPPEEDLTSQLQKLADLHDSGALTDEEFAAAKQQLLGG